MCCHRLRLLVVIASLVAASGCWDKTGSSSDDNASAERPAAARPPVQQETEKDSPPEKSENEESDDEPTEVAPRDEQPNEDGLTWFRGVDELPTSHPCHDSTPVVWADEPNDGKPGLNFVFKSSTLGELREKLGTDWVHFGPRTVRGVRWKQEEEEFLAVTCNMGGLGYTGYDRASLASHTTQKLPSAGEWLIGWVGEPSAKEYGSLYFMRRKGEGTWKTVDKKVVWSGDDESNIPEYVARARIVSAKDANDNGLPELTAITINKKEHFEGDLKKKVCDRRVTCIGFVVDIVAREGNDELTERVVLRASGKRVDRTGSEHPETMDDRTFELLKARLDDDREKAVQKAKAILREAEKID